MPEIIIEHAKSYEGITCHFSVENSPLGTAGGVKIAADKLDDIFVVLSGDAISNINLSEAISKHICDENEVTIVATTVENPTLYGVLKTDGDRVEKLIEKPKTNEFGNLVSTGIYVINKSVLSLIPDNVPFDFAKNLFPSLVEAKQVGVYRHEGYWCDIGDKKSYYNANFYMSEESFYPSVNSNYPASKIISGNLIADDAVVVGKCRQSIIGSKAKIASNAFVDGCVVLPGVTVKGWYKNCIIGNGFCERIYSFDEIHSYSTKVENKILPKAR
jgi:mannose-1-phosphate guanylyltransferase/phosphomannomutase